MKVYKYQCMVMLFYQGHHNGDEDGIIPYSVKALVGELSWEFKYFCINSIKIKQRNSGTYFEYYNDV